MISLSHLGKARYAPTTHPNDRTKIGMCAKGADTEKQEVCMVWNGMEWSSTVLDRDKGAGITLGR